MVSRKWKEKRARPRSIGWVRFNVPPNTFIIGHIGDGFLRVKWPNQHRQSTEDVIWNSSNKLHRQPSFCGDENLHALTSYFTNWVESSKFIAFKSTGSSTVAKAKHRRVSRPAEHCQSINHGHSILPHTIYETDTSRPQTYISRCCTSYSHRIRSRGHW